MPEIASGAPEPERGPEPRPGSEPRGGEAAGPAPASPPGAAGPAEPRHATWLELFFDLVAVAGVAQLAHLLYGEPDGRDLALYAVLFVAFWTAWVNTTLYGNVAADSTRTRTLLLGMFGLAVMASAVHGVREGDRTGAFALAYVLVRFSAGQVWQNRHQNVAGWPVAGFTVGVAPWIASLWAPEEARLWLWAGGLAIDLALTLAAPTRTGPGDRDERAGDRPAAAAARIDPRHLAERLGLFTLIVLGEGVYQLVDAASEAPWDRDLFIGGPAAFLALVLVWSLSLRKGREALPFLPAGDRTTPRLALGLHCCATGCLAALAAGMGATLAHEEAGGLPASSLIMAAGAAGYLLIASAVRIGAHPASWRRTAAGSVPALALCLLTALTADEGTPAHRILLVTAALACLSATGRTPHHSRPDRRAVPHTT
ncbi:low temperature requirement protein A [Streptomyces sp. NPDC097619]|uniref:low temperature requirement protein A n=1 Tax=Streptomyces sp. NPDC097619 TaxID=3157228 RepID=UPI00332D9FFD